MGLLQLINREKDLRKLFGQRELDIIKKQLLGVNLSPSEKTRLSRDIRPKFNIIKKVSNFEKEFSLKKAQEIKFIIEETKEIILNNRNKGKINKIFVFGSYIENKMRESSDIDMAINFHNISKKDATKFKIEMQGRVNSKVQISILNILPEKVRQEILNKGKVVYNYGKD